MPARYTYQKKNEASASVPSRTSLTGRQSHQRNGWNSRTQTSSHSRSRTQAYSGRNTRSRSTVYSTRSRAPLVTSHLALTNTVRHFIQGTRSTIAPSRSNVTTQPTTPLLSAQQSFHPASPTQSREGSVTISPRHRSLVTRS